MSPDESLNLLGGLSLDPCPHLVKPLFSPLIWVVQLFSQGMMNILQLL